MSIGSNAKNVNSIIFVCFITFGLVHIDRTALALLLPTMNNDLNLTLAEIGYVNMLQTIGFAMSPIFAIWSDRLGAHTKKHFIVISLLATAVLTAATMLANTFLTLLIIRTLLGIAEGSILPLMISVVGYISRPEKLSRNMSFVYAGLASIGSLLGPILITQLASFSNWRMTYLIISIPTVFVALLVMYLVKIPKSTTVQADKISLTEVKELFKYRNVIVCLFIAIFSFSFAQIILSFGPTYFVVAGGVSSETMGVIMSIFGFSAIVFTLLLPAISNKFGRKLTVISFSIPALAVPLLLYLMPENFISILVFVMFGGVTVGASQFFTGIIPIESTPTRVHATAAAFILSLGELCGAISLGVTGNLSESYGINITMLVGFIACVIAVVLMFFLKETLKKKNVRELEPAVVTEVV